jgi:hypothetical protein
MVNISFNAVTRITSFVPAAQQPRALKIAREMFADNGESAFDWSSPSNRDAAKSMMHAGILKLLDPAVSDVYRLELEVIAR